jgi:hypothetical protein
LKKKRQSKERKNRSPFTAPASGGGPEWIENLSEEEKQRLNQRMRERFGNEWRMENRSF